ncbi:MAG: ribonuclease III [Chloroflexi bacterium]|nr:ribonuclease III [Chloroflexota bacterium]
MPNFDAREVESASELRRRLKLPFADLALLTRALTHRSFVNEYEAVEDNERLEFLGDAVLDFLAGAWVYNCFPELPEGDLTKIRSALVRNDQLARFARKLELGAALRLGRGEAATGGRNRDNLLGSAFEALIGALYLDCGLEKVKEFVTPIFEDAREFILEKIHDPKSDLQEWSQSKKLGSPHYRLVSTSGPAHAATFEMVVEIAGEEKGRGSGTSKSGAEHAAAKDAMKNLGLI